MMKALSTLTVLMFIGVSFFGVVMANPQMWNFPDDKNTTPSEIEILSPINNTAYISSNFLFSITVGLPESSTATNTYIDSVYYKLDNQQNCITIYDSSTTGFDDRIESSRTNPRNRLFSYFIDLTALPSGNRSITVYAVSGSNYFNQQATGYFDRFQSVSNSTVNFKTKTQTIQISPTASIPEFSWLMILPLFISLLFIAVKLRHGKTPNQNK
jgi:hypothetical protein